MDEVAIFVFLQKGGIDYLKKEDADVYGLQEVKCSNEDLPKVSHYIELGSNKIIVAQYSVPLYIFLTH